MSSSKETNMHSMPLKIFEDNIKMETPLKKNMGTKSAKKAAKRRIELNNIVDGNMKRKEHEDYANSMISHSRMLKDEEHMRRMEMAEEEHAIKMEMHKEKLKAAVLERQILELKKAREALL